MVSGPWIRYYWPLVLLLLAAMAGVQVLSALDETAIWDEPVHIAAGYSYWTTRAYQMNPEHPALVKMLCALPLYLFWKPALDTNSPEWRESKFVMAGNLFLYRNSTPPEVLLFAARSPAIAMTLLLGLYMAWWTRRRIGPAAALFAVALFAFDPNFIAHGHYVTTDVPAALFIFTTCTLWMEYLLERRPIWLGLTGLSLGLAFATKYSTLFLVPVLVVLYGIHFCFERPARPARRALEFPFVMAALALASMFVLAAVYWPEIAATSRLDLLRPRLTTLGTAGPYLGWLAERFELRAYTFLIGIDRVSEHNFVGHPSYLMGNISNFGFRAYFPIAFAVKTTCGVLIGMAVALTASVLRRGSLRRHAFAVVALLLPAASYFAIAMSANINIGLRHILPVYPFLYAVLGCVITEGVIWKWTPAVLVLLVAIESLSIFPDYIAFFNRFVGGPDAGPKYLVDSNLDWGQGFKKLGRYMKQHGIARVCLQPFGNVDMDRYGVFKINLPPDPTAANCVAAVSATPLYGLYVGRDLFAALRARKPSAIVGHSIYIYDLRKPAR